MAKPTTEKPAKPVEEDSDSDSSDDEDYVPDAKDALSDGDDDMDESDTEQGNYAGGAEYSTSRSGKRKTLEGGDHDNASNKHLLENTVDEAEAQRKKAKLDALWAELNAPAPKPGSRPELLSASSALSSSGNSGSGGATEGASGKMVTITTTYDFAGETVTVTKDVPENSKEAKDYFRKKNKEDGKDTPAAAASIAQDKSTKPSTVLSSSTTTTSTSTSTSTTEAPSTSKLSDPKASSSSTSNSESSTLIDSPARRLPVRYIRRKSTLDALAATYGVKKPAKMNTLEKSKLDWNTFVGKEGIEDELKHHNKDGYMEKVAFLQRTDERRDQEYQLLKKKK
ncbi:hypothetical protein EMPS_06661 [Entomortierella parvispora]|uniref:SWR1-complex protein 5 n=1 Tax=Entomortierella parvispora TaxID=205924 RepID=A0A9P3LXP0_9FUNG|nr:hypothetical protein EMPS_06661 [Entomortierella parvispora]